MRKLKAFTLLELLFVMILTTLIVGIGYFTFDISLRQLNTYKKNSKRITEAFELTMLLHRDFAEAKSVVKSNDTLVFTNMMNTRFKYLFSDEYIIRSGNFVADTFFYNTSSRNEKFLDKPADPDNGLVDEIYFEIKTDSEQSEIFQAVKSYSADVLMQYENLK